MIFRDNPCGLWGRVGFWWLMVKFRVAHCRHIEDLEHDLGHPFPICLTQKSKGELEEHHGQQGFMHLRKTLDCMRNGC